MGPVAPAAPVAPVCPVAPVGPDPFDPDVPAAPEAPVGAVGRPVAPEVSSTRTWEGLLGSATSTALLAAVLWWAAPPLEPWQAALAGFVPDPTWKAIGAGLAGFVGCGLVFAGITDSCAMGMLIARMPWNTACKSGRSCCHSAAVLGLVLPR